MVDDPDDLSAWMAREILPHEAFVRNWLARRWGASVDVDDVIQESYCRIAGLASVAHIDSGRAYFFRTANSVAVDGMRRARTANVHVMKEIDWLNVVDEGPGADRVVEAGQELARVQGLLSKMSTVCRNVIVLRRVHGLSQRETAQRLGVSEGVVENHMVRGLRNILKTMAQQDAQADGAEEEVHKLGKH